MNKRFTLLSCYFFALLCITNSNFAQQATPASSPQVVDRPITKDGITDDFFENFAQDTTTSKVEYKDGKLYLYADPSKQELFFYGLMATMFTMLEGSCIYLARQKPPTHKADLYALRFCEIFLGGFDVLFIINLAQTIKYKLKNIPYVTLSKEGLTLFDKLIFEWTDVAHTQIESVSTETNGIYNSYRRLIFFSDHAKLLLRIPEKKSGIGMLPIEFEEFCEVINHYQKLYGPKKEA